MPQVRMPDGVVVRFPDDMPADQIQGMIATKFPDAVGGKAPIQSERGPAAPERQKTVSGAGTTWLEHAISDLPIVGPAIQTGSDYLGTEIMGRLSGQDPAQMRDEIWKRREQRTEDYPASAVSGAVAGNLGAFGGLGATATGARALGVTGSGIGARIASSAASSGAISTADALARGGDGADALIQGGIGATIGGAIPIVGGVVRAGIGAVGDRVMPTVNAIRNAPKEAERRLGLAVTRDKQAGPDAVMGQADEVAAREAGVPLLNVDRGGETTRALARSVANQSPEARGIIEKTANDRFAGQGNRAVEFVRRLTGGAVDDLGYQKAIKETARHVNKPAYDRAFAMPGAQSMWTQEFAQLMQAPAMREAAMGATKRGANRAAVEGFRAVKNPFVESNGRIMLRRNSDGSVARPTLQFWDQVKRNLDSEIGIAKRGGDDTYFGDLTALKNKLVATLDGAVPEYQTARQGAASFFGADDAIEAGKAFLNNRKAIPEARAAYGKFSPAEKAGFATGFASEIIDKIKSVRDRSNVIDQVFKSQAAREQMELVFGAQKARQIEAYVRVEDLADRLRGAMGNSTTARQLVELGIGAGGGFAVTGGDWKGALGGAALAKGGRYLGQRIDSKVMEAVARMLTADNPKALDQAVKLAGESQKYMQALEHYGKLLGAPARGAAMAGQ